MQCSARWVQGLARSYGTVLRLISQIYPCRFRLIGPPLYRRKSDRLAIFLSYVKLSYFVSGVRCITSYSLLEYWMNARGRKRRLSVFSFLFFSSRGVPLWHGGTVSCNCRVCNYAPSACWCTWTLSRHRPGYSVDTVLPITHRIYFLWWQIMNYKAFTRAPFFRSLG